MKNQDRSLLQAFERRRASGGINRLPLVYTMKLFTPKKILREQLIRFSNASFIGETKSDRPDGCGIVSFDSGEFYIGHFKKGLFNVGLAIQY